MEPLSEIELKAFFSEVRRSMRDDAMFSLCLFLGLRVKELSRLKLSDLNFESNEIRVEAVKNGITRSYELPDRLMKKVRKWLKVRKADERNDFLFPHRIYRDESMTVNGIQRLFKRICERAEVKGRTVHSLRHSCGMIQVQAGANAERVRRWLRHRSITSSQIYFQIADDREYEREASKQFDQYL